MLLGHQPLIVPFDFVIQPVQRALHLRHPLHKLIALFYQQSLAGTNGLIPLLEQGRHIRSEPRSVPPAERMHFISSTHWQDSVS